MQKNNTKKIIVLIIAFVISLSISLTYISTGSFNVISFVKSSVLLVSQSEEKTFDRDYISSNQVVTVSEPNGVGTISYGYSISFDNLPKKIACVSVEFDEEKTSVGNISLSVTTKGKDKTFNISDTGVSEGTQLIQIGDKFVDDLKLVSHYDSFGGSSIINEEIVSISSVKINNPKDIEVLKRQQLIDVVKSLFFSILVVAIGLLIFNSNVDKKIFNEKFRIEKSFVIFALVAGLVFSFLMPIYQVPDERAHINIIYYELNWDIDIIEYPDTADFADTIRIIRNYDEKVNLKTYFNMATKAPLPSKFAIPSITIIKHLPQAIGFVLATLLRLPLWVCVSFAEICALLAYVLFGYFAIKIMPFKKEVMTAVMLLPVCLQEFPSLSYDSFLLSSYFLLFAYIMYVKFTKEKFTLIDVLIIFLLTIVIVITKIPYALVVGLVLLIPISKIDFNFGFFRLTGDFIKKHKIVFVLLGVGVMVVAGIFAIKMIPHISEGKTFLAAMQSLKISTKLIYHTIKENFNLWLLQITGELGWFDTPVALAFTVFVVVNLLFLNFFDLSSDVKISNCKKPFKIVEILLVVVIAIAMSYVTMLSMYGWTLQANGLNPATLSVAEMSHYMGVIPYIGGIQGRYFIPVIPLLLAPCCFPKVSGYIDKVNQKTYLSLYHLVSLAYLVIVLLNRYWI